MSKPFRNPVSEAVCKAAGWPFCAEHNSRASLCEHLHASPGPQHVYWCEWPDRECICASEAADA